jgi:thiosulfate dehydrogenase
MRLLQSSWFPVLLGIIIVIIIASNLLPQNSTVLIEGYSQPYNENGEWRPPDDEELPAGEEGDLILYGRDLIVNTSRYLGPKGVMGHLSNGMNCQNCHLEAGTKNLANPFSAVASTYPRYRDRSGRNESIEFRVNECMERSMNGEKLDSLSLEMRAIIAYLKWIGKDVPKGVRPKGGATEVLTFLDRAADPQKGKHVYIDKCQRCHGANGEGLLMADSTGYTYPPLWGDNSYNVSAGIYQLSRSAGFIKDNMPFGVSWQDPELSDEEAWDVAAYINSQNRPQKLFAYDWPNLFKKPVDYPFGPYVDSFPEQQHKYGPFEPIKKRKEKSRR